MPPAGCAWKGATRHARPARGRALLRAHLRGAFQHDAHAAAGARVVPVGQALQRAHLALEAHAACARRPGSAPPAPVPQRPPARSQNAQRALLGRRARSQGHVRVPRPSRHCLAAACACAPAAAHTATRRSARLALPAAANRHVGRRARGSECATPCQHTTAEATSGRADDVHALAQQQAVHVDGPGGAVIRQDVGQLAGALHHVRERRPARGARRAPLCPGCTLRARRAGAAYQRVQL